MSATGRSQVVPFDPASPMIEGHEGVLLGALMRGHDLSLDAEDFFSPPNRLIFAAIQHLGGNRGLLAVIDELKRRREFEAVGGRGRLNDIYDLPHDADNLAYAFDEVLSASRQRRERDIGKQLQVGVITSDEAQEQLQKLHGRNGAAFQDAADLLSKPIVTPPDVIEGLVHQGGKLVLGGASKSYKTWLLADLAVSKSTGSMWLDFPTSKGRVFYVNCELPEPFFWKRVRVICDERQLTIESGMLAAVHLRGRIREWSRIQKQIRQGQFSLIILDPIYKLLFARGGFVRNENDPGPIAVLLDEIETLATRTDTAVAFGAHYSKGDQSQKEAIDRISGSGIWTRDADSIINFTKHEDFVKGKNECYSVEPELRVYQPKEPFVVRWEYPLFITDSTLDPTKLKQAGRKADSSKNADVVFKLLTRKMSASEWEKAAKARGISRATFFRRIRELEDDGKVQLTEDEEWSPIR
jgi:RecA-family ATPase